MDEILWQVLLTFMLLDERPIMGPWSSPLEIQIKSRRPPIFSKIPNELGFSIHIHILPKI